MALVKPARRRSGRNLVGVFDTGTAAVPTQVRSTGALTQVRKRASSTELCRVRHVVCGTFLFTYLLVHSLPTQDVSYLADRPGHGSATLPLRHGSPRHFVDYQIPPTQIPEADHVRVAAPQHGYTRPPGNGRAGPATYSSYGAPSRLQSYPAALWAPEQSNGLGHRSAALTRLWGADLAA